MPWHIEQGSDQCDDGQWAVLDDEGNLAEGGCHDDEETAQSQADALNEAEGVDDETDDTDEDVEALAAGRAFITCMSVEVDEQLGKMDGRVFPPGCFVQWRPLPLTVSTLTSSGHSMMMEAVASGHVDQIKRVPGDDPTLRAAFPDLPDGITAAMVAVGVFDSGEAGTETARMIDEGTLSRVSMDPGSDIVVEERCTQMEDDPDFGEFCVDWQIRFLEYEIGGFTVVDVPGIPSASIRLASVEDVAAFEAMGDLGPGEGADPTGDEDATIIGDDDEAAARVPVQPLVASGARSLKAPARYREKPDELADAGFRRLHVTEPDEDGWRHVYGYVAPAEGSGVCHTGYPEECIDAPPSATSYARFRTGSVLWDDDVVTSTGVITMGTGHAPHYDRAGRLVGIDDAVAHYDNNALVAAYVNAGDDEHGWWVTGVCRYDITPEEVMALRGGVLSGDWRWDPQSKSSEGCAALVVNSPGFTPPLEEPRVLVASGQMMAATGLGSVIHPEDCGCGGPSTAAEVAALRATVDRHEALLADHEVAALTASVHRHTEGDVELARYRLGR